MEVEVREEASQGHRSSQHHPPDSTSTLLLNNTPSYPIADGPMVIVRAEEVLLVVLVLVIWVAAIALFFNRWGKIRMLEPYQPKFRQQPHRPSCPLAPLSPPPTQVSAQPATGRTQKLLNPARMSFSKYNVNALTDPLSVLPSPIIRRPRQNSVFVGSSTMAILNPPPRRAKSAMDIQHLVVNDRSPTSLSGSFLPLQPRRPSITLIPTNRHHRLSIAADRPPLLHRPPRRSSCFVSPPPGGGRHRHFISFDQTAATDRRTSVSIGQTAGTSGISSMPTPTVYFEAHVRKPGDGGPFVIIEEPYGRKNSVPPAPNFPHPKMSRSFEQPPKEKKKPERMANSLDVSALSFDRRESIVEEDKEEIEEDRTSPVSIYMDESKITAPLLEGLKSSDV